MKNLLIALMLAGIVPAANGGNRSFQTSSPNCRARTLDLRAGSSLPIIGAYATIDLGNIDFNFWGTGVRPDLYNATDGTGNYYWTSSGTGGTVNAQAAGTHTLSYVCTTAFTSPQSLLGVSCLPAWAGTDPIKNKKSTLAVQSDSSDTCSQLWISGYLYSQNNHWQQAFDTLTHFIETCPNNIRASNTFLMISSAMVQLHGLGGGSYRATYESWLQSVLYLSTSDYYFCACAEQIAGYLPLPHDTLPGNTSRATNIPLSVIYWLIHNTSCDTPFLSQEYDQSRQTQLDQWSNDPLAYKLDTTLPPLDSIQPGLKELLERHLLDVVSETPMPNILSNITASPNPTGTGAVISFGISKEAYVKIEVFDLLGNRVSSAGFQSLFEPGNKAVPISLSGLPSGTYFARIVTAYGEVQTVKLVKE